MANVVLLGIASQRGVLPVSADALEAAIERNDVSVDGQSVRHFGSAGRGPQERFVVSGIQVKVMSKPDEVALLFSAAEIPSRHLNRMCTLASDLIDYQNRDLALALLSSSSTPGMRNGMPVATVISVLRWRPGYHKLLAYKDEYEVARLLLDHPSSIGRVTWLLHPPVLRARGLTRKLRFGSWSRPAMKGLRAARRIRGTALDPFGRTSLRRTERRLPTEYLEAVHALLRTLNPENLSWPRKSLLLPMNVRGYESVKERSITTTDLNSPSG